MRIGHLVQNNTFFHGPRFHKSSHTHTNGTLSINRLKVSFYRHRFLLQGLYRVSSYLLGPKCLHPKVVFFNLREDLAVDCDGNTFSPREVRTQ